MKRRSAKAGFRSITLYVKFNIAELVEMSPDWAFVRSNSTETIATDATSAENNQELFICKKLPDAHGRSRSTASPAPAHRCGSKSCMLFGRPTVRQDHDHEASSEPAAGGGFTSENWCVAPAVPRDCAQNGPLLLASIHA
jgi:hypothetical protein